MGILHKRRIEVTEKTSDDEDDLEDESISEDSSEENTDEEGSEVGSEGGEVKEGKQKQYIKMVSVLERVDWVVADGVAIESWPRCARGTAEGCGGKYSHG